MAALLLLLILSGATLSWGLVVVKSMDQRRRDHQRSTYRISFPADLDPERVTAWIRSISGTMRVGEFQRMFGATPTLTLELWGTSQGIMHLLHIPWQYEPYIRPKLETLVPGVRLTKEPAAFHRVWVHAVEVGLRHKARTIRVYDAADVAASLLTTFSSLTDDETLLMQWVISPAVPTHKPEYRHAPRELHWYDVLAGGGAISRDEVTERRDKLDEPNMRAVLRVAAVANTPTRGQYMVRALIASLDSTRGPSTRFYRRLIGKQKLQERIDMGASPVLTYPVMLSAPELTAVIGWPLNSPMVAGLPAAMSRYIPANLSVPREGRVLGLSNYPGSERPIAQAYDQALKHTHVVGGTGSGKTTMLANMARQDIEHGYGVVLIESKGDLFNQTLDYIPPDRLKDVIMMDVNDVRHPVGFNILQQGDPAVVVDELNMVFNELFKEHQSLWMQEMMYHGLHTLVNDPRSTFVDLAALVSPNFDEEVWRDNLVRSVRDPQLVNFWKRFDNESKLRQDQIAAPVLSRVWPMARSRLVNIVGQSVSSFQMSDLVKDNKILLVNLSGIERGAATLMGTVLVNSLWQAVKKHRGTLRTFLYLDEAHHYMNLPLDLEQMLVEARSMGLGMVLAHQHLKQLPPHMHDALMSNARTKVVFQASADDAAKFAASYGKAVTKEDFLHLAQFEALCRVETSQGMSAPFTLGTRAPAKPYGLGGQVRQASREQYGRNIQAVQDEILARRSGGSQATRRRPPVTDSGLTWG